MRQNGLQKCYTTQDREERENTTIEHMFIFNDTMEYEDDCVIFAILKHEKVQTKNAFCDAQNKIKENFDTKKVINQLIISTNTTI